MSASYTTKIFSVDGIVRSPEIGCAHTLDLRPGAAERRMLAVSTQRALSASGDTRGSIFDTGRVFSRMSQLTAVVLVAMLVGAPTISAYEAHIANVTATFVQIDPPVLTPPGPDALWNETSGGSDLRGSVEVDMTDADPDAHYIFFTSASGSDPSSVLDPACGEPSVPGESGGGAIETEMVELSLTSTTVIKAIACDGDTASAHRSVTNTKIYYFADVDDPVADSYSPIADAYVQESDAGGNHGTENTLFIASRHSARDRRIYIRFDFHFPASTIINASSLKLFMSSAPSAARSYEARHVTGAWTESGITWNNQPCGTGLASCATLTDATTSPAMSNVTLAWDVTPDVLDFVSGASANNGWELNDSAEGAEGGGFIALFRSRETTGVSEPNRPYLEVHFTPPQAATDHLVINEVYPNIGNGKGTEVSNEWVEIYNPTSASVDISGWQLCDSGFACDTIAASTPVIPSHGFALIANATTTWSSFWTGTPEAAAAVQIGLGTAIGSNGLSDAGDRVILRDGTGAHALVDAMSYGTDVTYMSLSAPRPGISLSRIVKGYDTDAADDWVLNNTPNPGTNPSEDGTEVMRFTSDGVEIGATEADLPPIPDSSSRESASDDGPLEEEVTDEGAAASSAGASAVPASESEGEITPDTTEILIETASGTATSGESGAMSEATVTDSSSPVQVDTEAADTDAASLSNDSPAAEATGEVGDAGAVSQDIPPVPADATADTTDDAPLDNTAPAGSADSDEAPSEGGPPTPSDATQDQAILPKPDEQLETIQPTDEPPDGSAPPPPPETDSASTPSEPLGDASANE
ncbi:MAG: DNRLRE domain-containing protein [bacterium]|nr:DNRLRE domain-containing protein [bacterium]MDZ4284822.1 DNRLRE domain-containing protein [Patescibacteria group bacterium]